MKNQIAKHKLAFKTWVKKQTYLESVISFISKKTKKPFLSTQHYWENRYRSGGNSGHGSYGELSKFKAQILNDFVKKHTIKTVIEFGCGDGHQLSLAQYPSYIGFDISKKAIELCSKLFQHDETKIFKHIDEYANEKADLVLSLDVIFHLIEDDVFNQYMHQLFDSSGKKIIIYSSNTDINTPQQTAHFKNRHFSKWVEIHKPNWVLEEFIPNPYPYNKEKTIGSVSDFYVFKNTL